MGPLSYMQSVVDRNVVMWRIPAYVKKLYKNLASAEWLVTGRGREANFKNSCPATASSEYPKQKKEIMTTAERKDETKKKE